MARSPRTKEATGAGDDSDSIRQAADLAALKRMLVASEGTFSLSFVLCQDPALRSSLLRRLTGEFPGIFIVHLPPRVDNVFAYVRSQLPPAQLDAVFILDLESSIPFEDECQTTLRLLNSSREQWEALRCPVVFWLAEYGFARLAQFAPDFWRYRSHQFEFIPETLPLEQIREQPFPGHAAIDAMPYEEKLFRASELEARLAEAGDPPSRDFLSHALLWSYELAALLEHLNRFEKAEAVLRRALHWAEKAYGEASPHAANALNNLASLLHDMNRLAEAEPLIQRALKIDETHYGPDHPSVATDLNNLAQLLKSTNRLTEAEPLIHRALKIDETHYGPDHPSVATVLNNLAQLLKATNRLAEAEPLMRRALKITETCYGPDHPSVTMALNNLASLFHDTNRLAEAEPLMRRALKVDETCYGPDHPSVAIRLNNLASLFKATNRLAEAEPLMHRALKIDETSYGPDHPSVAVRLNNLAQLFQDTNRLAEAEPLMRRALKIDEASHGPDDPNVAIRLNNLAQLFQDTNRREEAEPLMRRAVEILAAFGRRTKLQHPRFGTAVTNYSLLLKEMGISEDEITSRLKEIGVE